MRCYFMRNGHIFAVEELTKLSDAEAVEQAMALYKARGDQIDGGGAVGPHPQDHALS